MIYYRHIFEFVFLVYVAKGVVKEKSLKSRDLEKAFAIASDAV